MFRKKWIMCSWSLRKESWLSLPELGQCRQARARIVQADSPTFGSSSVPHHNRFAFHPYMGCPVFLSLCSSRVWKSSSRRFSVEHCLSLQQTSRGGPILSHHTSERTAVPSFCPNTVLQLSQFLRQRLRHWLVNSPEFHVIPDLVLRVKHASCMEA